MYSGIQELDSVKQNAHVAVTGAVDWKLMAVAWLQEFHALDLGHEVVAGFKLEAQKIQDLELRLAIDLPCARNGTAASAP